MQVSWIRRFKKSLLKSYAKRLYFTFERQVKDCQHVQERVLFDKIRRNQNTVFGREKNFAQIRTLQDYQAAVSLSEYENFLPYIERAKLGEKNLLTSVNDPIESFALTSGTTKTPKFIPVTKSFREEYHTGSLIWSARLFYQLSDILEKGKILQITSPGKQSKLESGLWCGNISGAIAEMQKPVIKEFYAVPSIVSRIPHPQVRFYTILRIAMTQLVSLWITANPSLVLALADMIDREKSHLIRDIQEGTLHFKRDVPDEVFKVIEPYLQKNPKRAQELEALVQKHGKLLAKDVWPELSCIACWTGGTLSYYLEKFPEYFGKTPVREIGLLASEGRFSIPVEGDLARGVLDIASHFFEFIPEEDYLSFPRKRESGSPTKTFGDDKPKTLLAHELEVGKRYFLVVTTSSGLYRYQMHDLIEVTGFFFKAPIIQFLSKASHFSSVTGEKLSEFQVVESMHKVTHEMKLWLNYFRFFPSWGEPPYYNLMIEKKEADTHVLRLEEFLHRLDIELQHMNMEYQGKRKSNRLGPLRLRVVHNGTFLTEKHERLKRGGSEEQYKPVYLSGDLKHGDKYSFYESNSLSS